MDWSSVSAVVYLAVLLGVLALSLVGATNASSALRPSP
jgi:hypothetical protein